MGKVLQLWWIIKHWLSKIKLSDNVESVQLNIGLFSVAISIQQLHSSKCVQIVGRRQRVNALIYCVHLSRYWIVDKPVETIDGIRLQKVFGRHLVWNQIHWSVETNQSIQRLHLVSFESKHRHAIGLWTVPNLLRVVGWVGQVKTIWKV